MVTVKQFYNLFLLAVCSLTSLVMAGEVIFSFTPAALLLLALNVGVCYLSILELKKSGFFK